MYDEKTQKLAQANLLRDLEDKILKARVLLNISKDLPISWENVSKLLDLNKKLEKILEQMEN